MREQKDRRREPEAEADGMIEGRNAVIEALRAGTPIDKIFLARGETDATLGHIASSAREKGIVVVEADRRKLDGMSRTHAHQGVIAMAAVREYATVDDILNAAREKGEPPLIVVCDELSDPHNLGAVIRTAAWAMTPWWEWVRLIKSSFFRSHSTTTMPLSRAAAAMWARAESVSPRARKILSMGVPARRASVTALRPSMMPSASA